MQGFNMGRYYPPEDSSSPPSRPHHSTTSLTIRFEIPYPIWCTTCPLPTLIPQGTRFNAQKTRQGAYHSTPIWHFRMRHPLCGGILEIKTDPENTRYLVVTGGLKQEKGMREFGENPTGLVDEEGNAVAVGSEGGGDFGAEGGPRNARASAFALLERTINDRGAAAVATERIDQLAALSEVAGADPGAANAKLRATFRKRRKELEAMGAADEQVKDRYGLNIDLLPGSREDELRASLVEFAETGEERGGYQGFFDKRKTVKVKKGEEGDRKGNGKHGLGSGTIRLSKKEWLNEKKKAEFVNKVVGNTRAASDPFLADGNGKDVKEREKQKAILKGIKRKRVEGQEEKGEEGDDNDVRGRASEVASRESDVSIERETEDTEAKPENEEEKEPPQPKALVAYGSDSDSE